MQKTPTKANHAKHPARLSESILPIDKIPSKYTPICDRIQKMDLKARTVKHPSGKKKKKPRKPPQINGLPGDRKTYHTSREIKYLKRLCQPAGAPEHLLLLKMPLD